MKIINIIISICLRGDDSSGGVVVACRARDILILKFVLAGVFQAVAWSQPPHAKHFDHVGASGHLARAAINRWFVKTSTNDPVAGEKRCFLLVLARRGGVFHGGRRAPAQGGEDLRV